MPSDLSKICEERARLLRDYSTAAGAYSESVRTMVDFVLAGQQEHLTAARSKCRSAWEETEKSRLALSRHEADHQCDRDAQISTSCPK